MTLLIVTLAVCLILGSMMWVLPSPRERQKMALRREAMRKGVQVQLSKLEDPTNPHNKIHCIAYRLPNKQLIKGKRWLIYREALVGRADVDGWGFAYRALKPGQDYLEKLAPILAKIPADALALEMNPASVGIYWNERGDSQDLETIFRLLGEIGSVDICRQIDQSSASQN